MTIYTTQQEPVDTKPVQGNVTVYNLMTGEASICAPIDARERVSRGGWSFDPLTMEPELPEVEVSVSGESVAGTIEEFVPDETIPPKRSRKKGR